MAGGHLCTTQDHKALTSINISPGPNLVVSVVPTKQTNKPRLSSSGALFPNSNPSTDANSTREQKPKALLPCNASSNQLRNPTTHYITWLSLFQMT